MTREDGRADWGSRATSSAGPRHSKGWSYCAHGGYACGDEGTHKLCETASGWV